MMPTMLIRRVSFGALVLANAALTVVGCGGDDTTGTPTADAGKTETSVDSAPPATTGGLKGNVIYNGVKRSQAIYTVLFTTLPPDPTKLGGAGLVPMATLPGTNAFSITGVKPGMYYLAVEILPLVMGPPPSPEADTPVSPLIPVTVTAGAVLTVPDITLTDPPSGDAGTDSASDAPSDAPNDG